ncbi:MAG: hypothetical protein E7416_04755 [Ruminococcaceae bacterium]|nr:hypothetical protein [Oscillospiraceae bacterium]
MKKLLLTFITIILVVSLAACQVRTTPDVEHTVGFYNLFGESTETVTKNIDFGNIEGVTKGDQTTYTFDCVDNDEGFVGKQLVFYNDILMAEETYFADIEQAYNFARNYRKDFELNFGEKDTYPNVSSTNSDYFDNVSGVEYLKDNCVYYEDYTVTVSDKKTDEPWLNEEKAERMMGDRKYSRIDLRLELRVNSSNSACVSVRYLALP